jgi:hypothetical protein
MHDPENCPKDYCIMPLITLKRVGDNFSVRILILSLIKMDRTTHRTSMTLGKRLKMKKR